MRSIFAINHLYAIMKLLKTINYDNCMQEVCKPIFMTYHARCDWYPHGLDFCKDTTLKNISFQKRAQTNVFIANPL